MKYLRVAMLYVCICLLLACDYNSINNKFSKFDREYSLQARVISTADVYQDGLFCFYDTLAILTRIFNKENQIHIFDEEFNFISSAGKKGKGPGEISNPFFATVDQEQGLLWYLDMGKKKMHKFPIDSLLRNPEYLPIDSQAIPVPGDIPILLQFYPHKEGLFSCANYFSDTDLISFFNHNGKVIDSLGIKKEERLLNLNSKEKGIPKVTFLYQKHPIEELYVSVYKYSDVVVVVDKDGNVKAMSQGPDMINQNPNALKENYKSTYTFVDCDEKYIYALYQGDYVLDKDMKPNCAHTIHVFNWKGKEIAKLKLDHPIATFSIQDEHKKIIAYSQSIGEFISFSIPGDLYAR